MKLAIIHSSDIHLSSDRDWIVSRAKHFVAASKSVINECQKVIVVISGDIANTGQVREYQAASTFLQNIEAGLKLENAELGNFEYIMVPGNHDCNLPDKTDPIRNTIIDSIKNKDEIQEQKFIDLFLTVQKNYWEFLGSPVNPCVYPYIIDSL
jgi:metallophosphoesterase superfamily enzyme